MFNKDNLGFYGNGIDGYIHYMQGVDAASDDELEDDIIDDDDDDDDD